MVLNGHYRKQPETPDAPLARVRSGVRLPSGPQGQSPGQEAFRDVPSKSWSHESPHLVRMWNRVQFCESSVALSHIDSGTFVSPIPELLDAGSRRSSSRFSTARKNRGITMPSALAPSAPAT